MAAISAAMPQLAYASSTIASRPVFANEARMRLFIQRSDGSRIDHLQCDAERLAALPPPRRVLSTILPQANNSYIPARPKDPGLSEGN